MKLNWTELNQTKNGNSEWGERKNKKEPFQTNNKNETKRNELKRKEKRFQVHGQSARSITFQRLTLCIWMTFNLSEAEEKNIEVELSCLVLW